jgi:DNA-binding CsgD family transcriptional regulator
VTRGAGVVAAEREVIRHCRNGLDVAELQRRVLRSLRRGMTIDAAFFATADPETLLFTGAHSEDPLLGVASLFLDNELAGSDVNTFTALATAPTHVASLDSATRGDRRSSARYRDIMRPAGLGDELRAALVAGGACWGYLCLHREDGRLGFTAAEADLITRVGPHIAHALRQAVLLHHPQPFGGTPRPGVVVLDEELNLVASTPEAEQLLPLFGHGSIRLPLPVSVYAVASVLTTAEKGPRRSGRLPSTCVRAVTGGWLNVHASRLTGPSGDERIAVVIEPADPHSALGIQLFAYGLSSRERELARLVLRGASTRAISESMHISAHTVQDHLKSVFDKVGVRSRRDLVAYFLNASRPPE